ncbi:MAG: Uma2 family endonuclease [Armatimonadetes bacterium]|nr:Uma2 family endonuclease [Armatimonadota bacterium]
MLPTLIEPQTERGAPAPMDAVPREYLWTVDAFCRVAEAGVFGEPSLAELVRGKIIQHPGQTPLHAGLTGHIAQRLRDALKPCFMVREHKPVNISQDTEPNVDVSVIAGHRSDFRERHPGPAEAALLVEVADSSVAYDTGDKALLYAQSDIADYWVVLAQEGALLLHRDPTADGYVSVTRLEGNGGSVSPLAASDVSLSVHDLLSLAER